MPTWSESGHYSPAVRAVAAYGLAGTVLELPSEPLGDPAFAGLHANVRQQKLTGLFWAAIRGGALPVTDEQRDQAEEIHIRASVAILMLEDLLVRTVTALDDAGIPVRVLKGPVSARLDHTDVSHRAYGDIDLLVPSSSYYDAVRLLESQGCRRSYPEPRPGFDQRFGKGTAMRTPAGLEIDLHRTFTMGPYGGLLDLDGLWRESEPFSLGGRTMHALPREARLLHACYHAALGDRRPQLVPLRDVAQILLTREIDWSRFRELMRNSRGEAVVARAIRTSWNELRLADVLQASAWASAHRSTRREASHLSVYGASSSYAARSFAAVRTLPIRQRPRYVLSLALPERSYLEDRHSGLMSRLRHGVTEIRANRSEQ
ncbi:nucleotidyltransferase family protein [Nocardioides mesophilus]|uniref:Nucleotidyltransferase family protein n=1 Tax=Nocardioides mesophilus TaxID=433659 RepID=A0A7G9R992_9ACTN|nr:nucleotidyltransferase family protein [Nocardioides mesophilus]QNN52167.1 nucleotidyltransferase family protein [Nocardioides mesophilus]